MGALAVGSVSDVAQLVKQHWPASDIMLTDSGTSALSLAIQAAVPPNSVVALPAWGCYDLATAAEGAGVRVALYDLDPQTLAPEPTSLGRTFDLGARAVVVAHFYGVPVDLDAISRTADPRGIAVIEDAAQAIGATLRGRPAGSLGAFGVLSFGRGKGLNGGGGGALLINTSKHVPEMNIGNRNSGWGELMRTSAQWLLARPSWYALPAALPFLRLGETIYHAPHPPRPLSRASARMLRANWAAAHAATQIRRGNAERLRRAVGGVWHNVEIATGSSAGYLRLPVRRDSAPSAELMRKGALLGIMPGYPETLLSLDALRSRCVNANQGFPGAESLARTLVTLPTHELLSEADLAKIEAWLRLN